jgi:hypothetical protein
MKKKKAAVVSGGILNSRERERERKRERVGAGTLN